MKFEVACSECLLISNSTLTEKHWSVLAVRKGFIRFAQKTLVG